MDSDEPSTTLSGSGPVPASAPIDPRIAIGAGAAWPILVAFWSIASFPGSPAEHLVFAAGLALVPALLGFALAYAIGLRKASLRWKLSGLLAIFIIAVLANFTAVSLAAPGPDEAPAVGSPAQDQSG